MFKSLRYVINENVNNLYRIYSISKYEVIADMRDSKLGLFWNFANPMIQVLTYWFVFGVIWDKKAVHGVEYIYWMLSGMVVWFFMSPCITNGCSAIFSKTNVITKMKFPVSILPATVILKELFNHFCLLIILFVVLAIGGYYPYTFDWIGLIYYLFCAIMFSIALSMTTSVLNMIARDTKKLVLACMRLLLYLTPILWPIESMPKMLRPIMNANPIYYIVQGYRDCFLYHNGVFHNWKLMIAFWVVTLVLLLIGSSMIYKFKHKFIDMI